MRKSNIKILHVFVVAFILFGFFSQKADAAPQDFLGTWGTYGSADGQFNSPWGVAVDSTGNVYVLDQGHNRIQVFTADGQFITKWGTYGIEDGQFNNPCGIAIDSNDNVYVADTGNNRVQVFSNDGQFLTKWGNIGSAAGQFNSPYGIAVDGAGNVYVADTGNWRIQVFSNTGEFIAFFDPLGATFESPFDVAIDTAGYASTISYFYFYQFYGRLMIFSRELKFINLVEGFNLSFGLTVNSLGYVYVADSYSNKIQIRQKSGQFITEWGSYGSGNSQFNMPSRIAISSTGRIYVADTGNHRIQIFEEYVIAGDVDADHDGFPASADCDDNDPLANPFGTEIYNNGVDENCNGTEDDTDADNDGFPATVDCDDNNPAIYPGTVEIPYNGIDENCNGMADDVDFDWDGYNVTIDCNDNDPNSYPGAQEVNYDGIDQDCDGADGTLGAPMYRIPHTFTNIGIAGDQSPVISGNIIAFQLYEWALKRDKNNDGDLDDYFVGYYDISTSKFIETNIEVVGGWIATDGSYIAYLNSSTGTLWSYNISKKTTRNTGINTNEIWLADYKAMSYGKLAYFAYGTRDLTMSL